MTNDEKENIYNTIKAMERVGLFCEKCRNVTCICKIGENSSIIDPLKGGLGIPNLHLESFRHSELMYKKDTNCFDDCGYVIFVHDIIKVTCYGGPDYYQVLPMDKGCFWIKQIDLTPDEIEHYGENINPLYWLMTSYMGKVVIPKDAPEIEKWLYRCVGF